LDCKVHCSFGHICEEVKQTAQAAKSKKEEEERIATMEELR